MAAPQPSASPSDASREEHHAVVCVPCPQCGEVIRTFTVVRAGRRDTATVKAECPACSWTLESDEATEELGRTSLAPPDALPTLPAPPAFRLDAPIFPAKPPAPPRRPMTPPPAPDRDVWLKTIRERGLPRPAGTPPLEQWETQDLLDLVRTHAVPPPTDGVSTAVRLKSAAPRTRTRQLRRSKREAWVLTGACLTALAGGVFNLVLLSDRLATWKIVLIAAVLLPLVALFLIDGLRGIWKATKT